MTGRHLALTIAYASRHGFQLVLLENVAPLLQDKIFRQMLEQSLSCFGYRIISEVCINISTFQPVDRTRAIFVVCHESLQVHTGNCGEIVRNLFDDIPTSLWQRCRWIEIENQLREDVGIPRDAMEELSKMTDCRHFSKAELFPKCRMKFLKQERSDLANIYHLAQLWLHMVINIICLKMVLSSAASGVILRGGVICIRLRQFWQWESLAQ